MALSDVIARLAVSLSMDTAAFEKGSTLAEKRMAQTQRKFEAIGKKMKDIGTKLSIGITAPVAAFGVAAFKAAMDAQELQSAFGETFGEMSGDIAKWAEETGNALGRSTTEMQKMAMGFGLFFNAAAKSQTEAAAMSKTFTVLAQDLASFFNTTNEDAAGALSGALRGESEGLRRYGVMLSDVAIKAKALELGLVAAKGGFTEQEKVMLRAAVIMDQTAKAQGDVARTSDSTANQLKRSAAAFEELQVTIGTKLLPVLTPLIERIGKAVEWFIQLPTPVQNTALAAIAVSAALGPVLVAVGALIPLLAKLAPAVLLVGKALLTLAMNPFVLGFAVVLGGIYLAWKNWDKITAIVQRLYAGVKEWIGNKLGAVLDGVKAKVDAVKGWFFGMYDAVVGHSYVPDMIDGIAAQMARLDKVMVDPAQKGAQKTADAMREMASEVKGILDRLFPQIALARNFQAELAAVEGDKGLTAEQKAAARGALLTELSANTTPRDRVDLPDVGPIGDLSGALDKFEDFSDRLASKAKETTVRVAKTFKDMATETIGALQRMTDAIKGGGFLDILSSVIGLGMQLGSIGAFGKSIQTNLNKIPGNANGTSNWGGGLTWVGERGPELINAPRGASIHSNKDSRAMMGGGNTYHISGNLMTPEFWARIHAGDANAAQAGAVGGVAKMQYRQSRQW